MSKKILIALFAMIIVFTCIFTACKNKDYEQNKPYIDDDKYEFVTDENGNKVLDENGEFIVYVTDENGKFVTNESGERVTQNQLFEAYSKENVIEDYGYKIDLPDGWEITDEKGVFFNKEKNDTVSVNVVDKTYQEYYFDNYEMYTGLASLENVKVTWEDDVTVLGEECKGTVRFTMEVDGKMNVMYFFKNGNNTYKILYESSNAATAIADSEEICKTISYKPYNYYEPQTDVNGNNVDIVEKPDISSASTTAAVSTTKAQ